MTNAALVHAAMILSKQDDVRQRAYDLASRVNTDGSVNLSPEKREERRQASNQKTRDAVYGKGAVRGAKDAISSAASNIASRAKGAASGARDAVMGTKGTDAADADINRRFSNLTGGDSSADPEGVFQGSRGLVGAAQDIAGRAVEGAQGAASSAMTRGKGILGAAKDIAGRAVSGAKDAVNRVNTPQNRAAASEAMSRTGQRVGQGLRGAAEAIGRGAQAAGRGAVAGAQAAGRGYSNLASEVVPRVDAAGAAAGRGLVQGAKALGRGAVAGAKGAAKGAANVAGTAMYGSDRSGRDASGFINPDDKLGTVGAGIKGALTGQGAMNAIEARNERRLGFDRDEQKGIRHAAGTLRQVENRGNLRGTTQQAMINASRGNRMAPMNTMSTTGSTMSTGGAGAGAPAAGGAAPAAPAPGGAAPAAPAAGGASPAAGGNQAAQNILAQRAGAQLADADARANKRGGLGGLGANVLGLGLPAAVGAARNAMTRRGGRKDQRSAMNQLNTLAGTDSSTFTASSDDPYDDFWDLQKTMHTFRIRDSTEALRYAYQ